MASDRKRCPMNFNQFCGAQCAWFNVEVGRCQMLEEFSGLTQATGRLTSSVNDNTRELKTLVEPLKALTRGAKNDLR